MISAQVFAGVAFSISWAGGLLYWAIALIPFLLQQILWCCRCHKLVMIIDSLSCLLVGGLNVRAGRQEKASCNRNYEWCLLFCECELMYMAFASAVLWIISGLLTLIFVGSGRHARWEELWNANTNDAEGLEEGRPTSPIVDPDATNATVDASTQSMTTAIPDTKTNKASVRNSN